MVSILLLQQITISVYLFSLHNHRVPKHRAILVQVHSLRAHAEHMVGDQVGLTVLRLSQALGEKPPPQRSHKSVVKILALVTYCWSLDPGLSPRAVRPWASCLTSLDLSFFVCKTEMVILPGLSLSV